MNMKPSPLRHLDLSDDKLAADITADKARQLSAAYEQIEVLQDRLRGMLQLVKLIAGRTDISPNVREELTTNRWVTDAIEVLS